MVEIKSVLIEIEMPQINDRNCLISSVLISSDLATEMLNFNEEFPEKKVD